MSNNRRGCNNCEFANRHPADFPCRDCNMGSMWRAATNMTFGVQYNSGRIHYSKNYTKYSERKAPVKVIFNDPATIVFWHDGTKTVVKAIDEPFDPEKGLAMAFAKKYLGNKGNYYNTFKKWLPEEESVTIDMNYVSESLKNAMNSLRDFASKI